jgi:23S rRNA (guanosine2251-2'-O)-methyltransferase
MDRKGMSTGDLKPGSEAISRKLENEELDRLTIPAFKEKAKTPMVIVLDNVRSLNNIGSIFRTADAFLVEAIYLCGITACPPHKDIQKTALGATESVQWQYFETTMQAILFLKEQGYTILAIEQVENSTLLNEFNPLPDTKYAVILGHEVFGVDQAIVSASDLCIEIPQYGTKHSLNIAISAGIVIWDLFLKLKQIEK